jgi:hypothetical protein
MTPFTGRGGNVTGMLIDATDRPADEASSKNVGYGISVDPTNRSRPPPQ